MDSLVYIDGIDALATYGLRLGDGSLASLIQWAELKDVYANDWHEEDGIEPDLTNPVLDTRKCTLSFVGNATTAQVDEFVALWSNGAYHTLTTNVGFSYRLRLVSNDSLKWENGLCIAKFTFADDFPLDGYTYKRPSSTIASDRNYIVDFTPLTTYGVSVLTGINSELLKFPETKENLMRSFDNVPGVTYDSTEVHFKAREVRIPCLMRATSLNEFKTNYNALLYTLTQPGEHTFIAAAFLKRYIFHYVSQNVRRAYLTGKLWVEFDIVIKVIAPPSNTTSYDLEAIRQE
jgi:hypothetical protein